jgi:outer membrane immunogenic protein
MKKFLLGSALAILSTSAALAADMPAKAPAQVYQPTPAYNWSGLYLGAHGGYGWGENKISDSFVPMTDQKLKPSGGFGGVQIGYNTQFAPHWLVGGEIDFSMGDIETNSVVSGSGGNPVPLRNKFDFFGTARTRFGYVQDRTLIYATVGAIWLRDKYQAQGASFLLADTKQYHVGWVFGAGIEQMIDQRWSWKLEYLYAPFDRSNDSAAGQTHTFDANFSVVKAGLNYRFSGGEPAASYMPVKAAAPRFDWNGSYLGVHGGYGWAKLTETEVAAGNPTVAAFKPDGGYGGFQGGYNWLYAPNSLIGIEVDSSFGDLKDSGTFTGTATAKIEDLGTARLRLGYLTMPSTLFYVTGGAAYAREKLANSATPSTKVDHLGWTVGAGVEYKFAPEWSLKAEYLYADLGTFTNNVPAGNTLRHSDLTLNTVRVGLNYSGPVIERFFGGR